MFPRTLENELAKWADSTERKPLLLRGARQVGKTTIARRLGAARFQNLVELNLDDRDISRLFREELGADEFIDVLRVKRGMDITLPGSLLFIDEIQEAPWMLNLLRFLYEKHPGIAVLASGSLLEVKLKEKKFSVPVGRLENRFVHPLDFFEFLEAIGETAMLQALRELRPEKALAQPLHDDAMALFHKYVLVGGMPEIVRAYAEKAAAGKISALKSNLLTNYHDDMSKYASRGQVRYLEHVLENAPLFAGTRYSYEKFASSKFSYREMKAAFSLLSQVMLLSEAGCTDKTRLPIVEQAKRQKKLTFLDVGLVSQAFGLGLESPPFSELSELYRGQIAEQVVAQHLVARDSIVKAPLNFWARQSTDGAAEVDFIMEHQGRMVAVEVKSGAAGRLFSLRNFGLANREALLVRVYSGHPRQDSLETVRVHSIPFYLLPRLKNWLGELA